MTTNQLQKCKIHYPWNRDSDTQCVANMVLQENGIRSRKIFSSFTVDQMTECMIMPIKPSNYQMIKIINSLSEVQVLRRAMVIFFNNIVCCKEFLFRNTGCSQVLAFYIKKEVNRLLCRMGQIYVQSDKITICYKGLVINMSNSNSTVVMNIYK